MQRPHFFRYSSWFSIVFLFLLSDNAKLFYNCSPLFRPDDCHGEPLQGVASATFYSFTADLTKTDAISSLCIDKQIHPFFISVTELRLDSPKKTFTISCRMFTDDLQQALYKTCQYKGELERREQSANAYLAKYMGDHLQIKVSDQPIHFNFVGFETEEEATWVYLEAARYPGTGKVAVTNTLLYDFISTQTNIVHFYRDGSRSSTKLTNPEKSTVFN